jgi:predicted O-methyltransferase YrrM
MYLIIQMSIRDYLNSKNVTDYEGNSGDLPEQTKRLEELCEHIDYMQIMEIGFNAGHSANTFLSHTLAHVTSFDLNVRDSVSFAKEYIDKKYPERHTLIIGDSTKTIPQFIEDNPTCTFDLIFIDGGHTFEIAMADLENCKKLAHKNTLVVVDDVVLRLDLQMEWSMGPSKAWAEAIMHQLVIPHNADIYARGRGMVWGTYQF